MHEIVWTSCMNSTEELYVDADLYDLDVPVYLVYVNTK